MGDRIEIRYIPVNDLHPYENNPRLNEDAVPFVESSIRDFGMKVPIVVDSNNVIVCGHTRVLACKNLKMDEVPCIVADDLSPEQIDAFRLADNKVSELAGWDFAKLDIELANLNGLFDMEDFGFILEDFDNALANVGSCESFDIPSVELDDTPAYTENHLDSAPFVESEIESMIEISPEDVIVRKGDVISLGRHTLFCGNVLNWDEVMVTFGEDKADIGFAISLERESENLYHVSSMIGRFAEEIFCGAISSKENTKQLSQIMDHLDTNFKDMLYWVDTSYKPAENDHVIESSVVPIAAFGSAPFEKKFNKDVGGWTGVVEGHNTGDMLPLSVLSELIEHVSDEDAVVFGCMDPYGTILIACEDTGRIARHVEESCEACQYIVKRYIERTGTDSDVLLYRDNRVCPVIWH